MLDARFLLNAGFVALMMLAGLIAGRFFRYAATASKENKNRNLEYTLRWAVTILAVFLLLIGIGEVVRTGRVLESVKWAGIFAGVASTITGYFLRTK